MEEKVANGIKSSAARKTHGSRGFGTPNGWKAWDFHPIRVEARKEAKRIIKIMADEGILPEDPMAREALEKTLQLMREQGSKDFQLKAARTILEYRLAKPTVKQDVTVRTAEDWLADLAAKESDDKPAD